MDRDDWMYKTSRLDLSFLENVRKKFLPVAQKHRLSLGRDHMICPCDDYKNRLAQEDNMVQSHLLWNSFIKELKYTVWKYHDEKDPSVVDAPRGTSSSTTLTATVNDGGQQPSTGVDDNASREYITMSDLLQDMGDDDAGEDSDLVDTLLPEDVELFEEVANRLNHDDILFGYPKWLENSREMKQAAIDPLYKDGGKCPKHWTMLRFNLQLLMLRLTMGGPTLASTTCYVSMVTRIQRVTRCPPIPIGRRS
jgi:hypothetical protein